MCKNAATNGATDFPKTTINNLVVFSVSLGLVGPNKRQKEKQKSISRLLVVAGENANQNRNEERKTVSEHYKWMKMQYVMFEPLMMYVNRRNQTAFSSLLFSPHSPTVQQQQLGGVCCEEAITHGFSNKAPFSSPPLLSSFSHSHCHYCAGPYLGA